MPVCTIVGSLRDVHGSLQARFGIEWGGGGGSDVFFTWHKAVEALATAGVANIATCAALPVPRSDICIFKLLYRIKSTAMFHIWRGKADVALLSMRKVVQAAIDAHPIASAHWLIVLLLRDVTPLNRWRAQVGGPLAVASHVGNGEMILSQKTKLT